jgi:hypothetical protein
MFQLRFYIRGLFDNMHSEAVPDDSVYPKFRQSKISVARWQEYHRQKQ